jgi:gamma-glutamylcyclotransferase (GGCT)/AIG2-like uncharacterized protein YtfP
MPTFTSIFVYGTLKQGECRADCWPYDPQSIQPAATSGALYDLGPYPALLSGKDSVLGEIWTFRAEQMRETLRVLDQIEGYGQGEIDLYIRQVVPCMDQKDLNIDAYCYFLADPSMLTASQRIATDSRGFCRWPKSNS